MKTRDRILFGSLSLILSYTLSFAQPYQSIALKVEKEVTLDARYYSPGQEGPAILLLCQCDPTTDQNEYNSLAQKLVAEGYHVLSFDYRGYGKSGGQKPDMVGMNSMEDVMEFWRDHWLEDVHKAYQLLAGFKGVQKDRMSIVGASCGNFLALEYALNRTSLKTLALLGGPVDDIIIEQLAQNEALSLLIIAGNEGPTFGWVDRIFEASKNENSRILKFKTITHGTGIFKTERWTEDVIVDWLNMNLR